MSDHRLGGGAVAVDTVRARVSARIGLGVATLGVAVLIAGCGSGGSSGTITVGAENQSDNALITETETTARKAPSSAIAKTPTSGPLATEPKVTPASGPAPSKLEVKDLIKGTGAEAKAGETVTVNYVGVLYKGGKKFDASWKRKEPFSFALGKGAVIPGWDQGIVGMKVGGRRELVIPPKLAYGAQGSGTAIPPNAPLVFVVDLIAV